MPKYLRRFLSGNTLPGESSSRFSAVPSHAHPSRDSSLSRRLTRFTPFPRDAVLLSLLYLDRISRIPIITSPPVSPAPLLPHFARAEIPTPSNPKKATPILNSFTLHRLVMSTMLVASKFVSDSFVPQTRSAKVGGLAAAELVRLEVEVLATLGWELKFDLVDLEELAKLLLREGEQAALVEKSETIAEPVTVKVVDEEGTEVEDDPNRTPTLPTMPSPELPATLGPPPPQLDSQLSSTVSSAATSPRLFSLTGQSSTTSTSPVPSSPSSVGGDTANEASAEEKEEERQLRLKASCETVRRMESLSMSGGAVSNEVVNVC